MREKDSKKEERGWEERRKSQSEAVERHKTVTLQFYSSFPGGWRLL